MGDRDVQEPGLTPPLPSAGLRHVLSTWSGEGSLYRALAAVPGDDFETGRRWTADDIRLRAYRIIFSKMEPELARLPTRTSAWLDALPVVAQSNRVVESSPFSGADWTETWRRSGWPPSEVWGRRRARESDSSLLTTFRWTCDGVLSVGGSVEATAPHAADGVRRQFETLRRIVEFEPLASSVGEPPSAVELRALRHEGKPWTAVADLAEHLALLHGPLDGLAHALLVPDPDMADRLFHLGVLGELLLAADALGMRATSRFPLGAGRPGPAYTLESDALGSWDLWFEAAGAWRFYGVEEPYRLATAAVRGFYQPLGADLMLLQPPEYALSIEVKYTARAEGAGYVRRAGYRQAATYLVQSLELARGASALVVGPAGVVEGWSVAQTKSGSIATAEPGALPEVLRRFFVGVVSGSGGISTGDATPAG